jgi:hypothetical protein
MIEPTKKLLRDPSSELVSIRLSALLRQVQLGVTLHEAPELARINSYIKAGNTLREQNPM